MQAKLLDSGRAMMLGEIIHCT